MLQVIREHAQGWVMRVIIAIIVLAFTLWGIQGYFGTSTSTTVATVNGIQITKEQLSTAYERLRRQAQMQDTSRPITTKDESILKLKALQSLTEIEALKQASINNGFLISDRQISNYLENMPEFQVSGRFSMQRFHEVLSATMLSTSEFFDLIKTSLLIDQPRLGVLLTSFAVPDEARYSIALVNQERNFSYLILPLQSFKSQLPVVTENKIKAYYDANKKLFMTKEQISVNYLELSLKDIAAKIAPNEAVIQAYYNDNVNNYRQPMKWRLTGIEMPVKADANEAEWKSALDNAQQLKNQLANETTFKEYQKKFPLSVNLEKDLLTLDDIPENWGKEVAHLNKGNISSPIRSSSGVVILKAIDVIAPHIESYTEAHDKVRQAYINQKAEEQFANLRDQLSELTYQHPDSLQTASEKLGLPIKESGLFSKETADANNIANNKKVRDVAFSEDVLVMKNNSDVVTLSAENAIVLHIKEHIKPSLMPFDTVKKQIEDKINQQSLDQLAKQQTQKLINELKAKRMTTAAIANQYKSNWVASGYTGRYANKIDAAILELVFSLPKPNATEPNYGVTRLANGNYVLVSLASVKEGLVPNDKQKSLFTEQLQNSEGLLEYELLKRSLLAKSKIDIVEHF